MTLRRGSEPVSATEPLVVCPSCGFPSPVGTRRCPHCLAELVSAVVASTPEARAARERALRARARRLASDRRARRVRILISAVAIALLGYWIYANFVREPALLTLPQSQTISAIITPDSWPNGDGGLGRQRRSASPSRLTEAEAWRSELHASPDTALVADSERLYLSLADGTLLALSARDGRTVWQRSYSRSLLASPALAAGRLYVPVPDGHLQALDAATGDLLWEAAAGELLTTSPLVADGTVYLFGKVEWFGFDAEHGDLLWRRPIDLGWSKIDREFLTPVVTGGQVAVGVSQRVIMLDRETGERTYWYNTVAFPTRLASDEAPPVAGDSAPGEVVYALSAWQAVALPADAVRPPWDGIRRVWVQFWVWGMAPEVPPPPRVWARAQPPREYLSPAVGPERLYVLGRRGQLVAISLGDGLTAWERAVENASAPPLLASDGLLVSERDRLLLLDPESGALVAKRQLPGPLSSAAVTSHGTYLATTSGEVLALR